jgi:ABC-type oligopeptide transport system ATPase subunit
LKVINLFGSPGSGKSTTAAGLFHALKTLDYNVELVTEVAKDLVWSKRFKCLENQAKVTVDQYERLRRLEDQVDYVITDSPILLGIFYQPKNYFMLFEPFVMELFESFDNINLFINRKKKYNPKGRMQTEKESNLISLQLQDLLRDCGYDYKTFDGNKGVVASILNYFRYIKLIDK